MLEYILALIAILLTVTVAGVTAGVSIFLFDYVKSLSDK